MTNQFRLKPEGDWHSKSRNEKLAAVMYPTLVDVQTAREMTQLARNEGKRSPYDAQFRSKGPVKSKDPWKLRSK
jgi:hypothetical protein